MTQFNVGDRVVMKSVEEYPDNGTASLLDYWEGPLYGVYEVDRVAAPTRTIRLKGQPHFWHTNRFKLAEEEESGVTPLQRARDVFVGDTVYPIRDVVRNGVGLRRGAVDRVRTIDGRRNHIQVDGLDGWWDIQDFSKTPLPTQRSVEDPIRDVSNLRGQTVYALRDVDRDFVGTPVETIRRGTSHVVEAIDSNDNTFRPSGHNYYVFACDFSLTPPAQPETVGDARVAQLEEALNQLKEQVLKEVETALENRDEWCETGFMHTISRLGLKEEWEKKQGPPEPPIGSVVRHRQAGHAYLRVVGEWARTGVSERYSWQSLKDYVDVIYTP